MTAAGGVRKSILSPYTYVDFVSFSEHNGRVDPGSKYCKRDIPFRVSLSPLSFARSLPAGRTMETIKKVPSLPPIPHIPFLLDQSSRLALLRDGARPFFPEIWEKVLQPSSSLPFRTRRKCSRRPDSAPRWKRTEAAAAKEKASSNSRRQSAHNEEEKKT